jgi:carboxyl-terminal processing protease
MKKYVSLILAAIALAVLSSNPFAQTAKENTPEVRQKTFEKVWKTVNEKYFDPTFGGVNWKEVHERYTPQIAAAKTDAEFYDILAKMLGELHTSHLEVIRPEEFANAKLPPQTAGMVLKELDSQIVVSRIWKNSSASESAIRPGFVLKTVDGTPVKTIPDALLKLYGKLGTKVTVSYLSEKDELNEAILERREFPAELVDKQTFGDAALFGLFETSQLEGGIGYVHFTNFITPFQKKTRDAFRAMHDVPAIIIDLRGNGGGDDSVGLAMINALFDKKTLLMISRTRKGDLDYYTAKPDKDPYTGKIVILLDGGSGSASEQFAAGMQESGRATIIGKKSVGADLDADITALPTGALFVYAYGQPRTPKGVIIEGRGVIPDIEVNLTRKALLAGKDDQLEAAIKFLKTGKN